MKIFSILLLLALQSQGLSALAEAEEYPNHCRFDTSHGYHQSLCQGLSNISRSQTNHLTDQRLLCSSTTQTHFRGYEAFDFDIWADLLKQGEEGKEAAFVMRQKNTPPSWQGTLNYKTFEAWTWDKCTLVTDSFLCGTKTKCKKEMQGGVEVETCKKEPLTCYADVKQYELRDCSDEKLKYEAEYVRPTLREWNIKTPDYDDVIPNKYDLLPGEVENVAVFIHSQLDAGLSAKTAATVAVTSYLLKSTALDVATTALRETSGQIVYSGLARTISPNILIALPRNDYRVTAKGNGIHAQCRQNADLNVHFFVHTIKRKSDTTTPNAFKLPQSWDGEKIEPLIWSMKAKKNRATLVHAYPKRLRLMDTSAAMVKLMADSSRKETSANELTPKAFYKNTSVQVRLVKKRWWWWDEERNRIHIKDVKGVKPSMNHQSAQHDVLVSDLWEMDLDTFGQSLYEKPYQGLFRLLYGSTTFRQNLQPNRSYALKVAVYQRGVKFYKQSCQDGAQDWRCGLLGKILWLSVNPYSEELEITFRTSKDFDSRTSWERFFDQINIGERFLFWVGDR